MEARMVVWGVICSGAIGTLLWVGLAGAKPPRGGPPRGGPPRGGLPACQTTLRTCEANLDSCQTTLGTCQTDKKAFKADLGICREDGERLEADLEMCRMDNGELETNLGICREDGERLEADLEMCRMDNGQLEEELETCLAQAQAFPATGQTTAFQADKNDGIAGPVDIDDDGTLQLGASLAYLDTGLTIIDLNTRLEWEKKDDSGGLHDKDNTFFWSGNGSQETIWDWLDDINVEGGTGFAGYSDWRLPNVKELQSIINYESALSSPSVSSEFDDHCGVGCTVPACSCTVGLEYWSSTSNVHAPGNAWIVIFNTTRQSNVFYGLKNSSRLRVRAVRGGQ